MALSMASAVTAGTATWAAMATSAATTEVHRSALWAVMTGHMRRIQPLVVSGSIERRGAG